MIHLLETGVTEHGTLTLSWWLVLLEWKRTVLFPRTAALSREALLDLDLGVRH